MAYKIGDMVTIKNYEDLVEEFGETDDEAGNKCVPTQCFFTSNMRKYCGKEGTIVRMTGTNMFNISFNGHVSHYEFDSDMVYENKNNYHKIRAFTFDEMAMFLSMVTKRSERDCIKFLNAEKGSL